MLTKIFLIWLFFYLPNLIMSLQLSQPTSNTSGLCTCTNITKMREYCGTELNRANGNQACTRDQYICGRSNWNKQAVIILYCLPGFECDVRLGGLENACTAGIDCTCPSTLIRDGNQTYCGSSLRGRDCHENVVSNHIFLKYILNFNFYNFRFLHALHHGLFLLMAV